VEGTAESRALGDICQRQRRGTQQLAHAFQALTLMETLRRHSEMATEQPRQMWSRQTRNCGQIIEGQITMEMRNRVVDGALEPDIDIRAAET
jgi:hypothetical protein